MKLPGRWRAVAISVSLAVSACTSEQSSGPDPSAVTSAPAASSVTSVAPPAATVPSASEPAVSAAPTTVAVAEPDVVEALAAMIDESPACDWLDPSVCLFPFPSSRHEQSDPATPTGVRLAIDAAAMPVNTDGVAIDPAPFRRNDGWSVATPIMFTAALVDPVASNFPPEDDIALSLTADSGTILLDLTTGELLAHWAELDERPSTPQDQRTTVLIRPAALLPAGHRIAVGVRTLVGTDGAPLAGSVGFGVVRDRLATGIATIEARRPALDATIDALDAAGMARADQWLAWDFTVISTESLTGEMLSMRDQAFELLGDGAPAFEITQIRTDDDGQPLPEGVGAWVNGTFEVPSFLDGDGGPGQLMHRGGDGNPAPNGVFHARFACALTAAQLAGDGAAYPVVYGHGLLGDYEEALRGDLGAAPDGLMLCATPWIGMAEEDQGYAASVLADINGFPAVVDRLRQSMVNQLFLARLIRHPDGLASAGELQPDNGAPLIDDIDVYFEGHSQGGIMGFATTAISTEWTKAVIGVPAVNYAFVIPRSNNWQVYGPIIESGYPGPVPSLLVLALLQQQWDRGEGSGYVAHLTHDPLPGTPEHQVLIEVALGDHQVTELGAYQAARTAGVPVRIPAFGAGRSPHAHPPYGLDTIEPESVVESALYVWDSGTLPRPLGSLSPDMSEAWSSQCTAPDTVACADPHEDPRRDPKVHEQRTRFFLTGKIEDPCGLEPCTVGSSVNR